MYHLNTFLFWQLHELKLQTKTLTFSTEILTCFCNPRNRIIFQIPVSPLYIIVRLECRGSPKRLSYDTTENVTGQPFAAPKSFRWRSPKAFYIRCHVPQSPPPAHAQLTIVNTQPSPARVENKRNPLGLGRNDRELTWNFSSKLSRCPREYFCFEILILGQVLLLYRSHQA